MNWEEYENTVYDLCDIYYQGSNVQKNVKKKGRYSKSNRQIDILIEQNISGNKVQIVIDCKLYNKKVDVKAVEAFISMVDDIGADKGILVSEKGYTKAALNRAYYNEKHIELDIYSLEELKSIFHSECAIPYAGENGIFLFAPFGWIVNGERLPNVICTLFQRGLSFEEALYKKELAYINFWNRITDGFNLEKLLDFQVKYTYQGLKILSLEYIDSIKRYDGRTKIRVTKIENYPTTEVTGFLEFDDFIVFCVWLCQENSLKRTISKLHILLKSIIPIKIEIKK